MFHENPTKALLRFMILHQSQKFTKYGVCFWNTLLNNFRIWKQQKTKFCNLSYETKLKLKTFFLFIIRYLRAVAYRWVVRWLSGLGRHKTPPSMHLQPYKGKISSSRSYRVCLCPRKAVTCKR